MTTKKATPSETKPEFLVVDDKLIAQSTEGELALPLVLKTKLMRSLRDAGVDAVEQFFTIVDSLGDASVKAKIDELDFMDTVRIANKFFEVYTQRQEALLGESSGSQGS